MTRRTKFTWLQTWGFGALFLIGFILLISKTSFGEHILSSIQSILWKNRIEFEDSLKKITNSKQKLLQDVDAWEKLGRKLVIDYVNYEQLKEENEQLRAELDFIQERDEKLLVGNVLAPTKERGGFELLIDIGSESGVEVGDAVVYGEGFFLGTISEVNERRSVVRLLHDERQMIAVEILNTEHSIGILEGRGGSLLEMAFLPQSITLEEGTLIITSGLDEKIPQGLIVGRITLISSNEQEPFQTVFVEPFEDLRRVTPVGVIKWSYAF